jgi:hypothetical protein
VRGASALLLVLAGLAGCGGGGGGLATSDAPCVPGMINFVGTLAGQAVSTQVVVDSAFFEQGSPPDRLDVSYEATETIELEWKALVPDGKLTAITGTFVMPQAAPDPGQTICAGAGSSLEPIVLAGLPRAHERADLPRLGSRRQRRCVRRAVRAAAR